MKKLYIQKNIIFRVIFLMLVCCVAQSLAEENINKLKDIKTENSEKEFRMTILTEYPIKKYNSFSLLDETPPKLVIDLAGKWESQEETMSSLTANDTVKNIRIGEHPDYLRIVLDLKIEDAISPIFEEKIEKFILTIVKHNQKEANNHRSIINESDIEEKSPEKDNYEQQSIANESDIEEKSSVKGMTRSILNCQKNDTEQNKNGSNILLKYPDFQLRLASGYLYYEYQEDLAIYRDFMPFLGIGANLSLGNFSINGYYQGTDRGSESSTNSISDGHITTVGVTFEPKFKRQDYSVSVAYSIFDNLPAITEKYLLPYLSRKSIIDNLTFFAGYKSGESWFDFGRSEIEFSEGRYLIFDENEADFEIKGPFLGVSCGKALGNSLLSFNIAASYLNMDFKQTAKVILGEGEIYIPPPNEYSKKGVLGFALGVEFNAPITEKLHYNVSIGGHQYDFDKYMEKIFYLRIGLTYSL